MKDASLGFSHQFTSKTILNRKGIRKLWWHTQAYAIMTTIIVFGLLKLASLVLIDSLATLKSLQRFNQKNKIVTKIVLFP